MILALALVAQPASAPAPAVSGAERWDLAVEVARPVPLADAPLVAALPEALSIRLDVYKDDGATLIDTFYVAPTVANPDWTASFGGDPGDAEWVELSWAALSTDFLTVELVHERAGQPEAVLARYVYVPTARVYGPGETGFHRPVAHAEADASGADAVLLTVAVEDVVTGTAAASARSAGWAADGGASFEEALGGSVGPASAYVMPYDHGAYRAACTGAASGVWCPSGTPDYFLARVPVDGPRPTAATQRYAFAGEVVLRHGWGTGGVVTWEVPGLALSFGAGRRLVVEGALAATGVRLSEAVAEEGWGGVVFCRPSVGEVTTGSALRGVVVERVRSWDDGVVYGAVSVHDRVVVIEAESEIRDGEGGVTGLLATGGAEVTVTGESFIQNNDGGGVRATGGARVIVSGDSEVRDNPGGAGVTASGYGTLVELVGATVSQNGGVGVRALAQAEVRFANDAPAPFSTVADNAGGLDAGSGGSLDAGQCTTTTAPCPGRTEHFIVDNDQSGAYFDARALTGSTLYAQGNDWDVTDISQLVLVEDASSVLVVCPIIGGGACALDARLGGNAGSGEVEEGEPPLRLQDILALVDEAERARLAGDIEAFEIAASAAVVAMDTSQAEEARRAAFEVTSRFFAWEQPAGPLAALESLAAQPGGGRPWALRALGVARASAEGAGGYADARALADTLASAYAGSEHAAFGLGLAVRVAVAERDEAGAVAALLALASASPAPDELGALAALVLGAFPGADLSGLRLGGGAAAPPTEASATASGVAGALLAVEAVRPNPASGAASVPFALGAEAEVEAVLYDVLGRRLAVLASGPFAAGRHVLVLDGARLPSGTYVVYVTARAGAGPAAVAAQPFTLAR